jgi:pSer/pThr/pTyr-binding forkhead associated (FHA) protein
MSQEPIKPTIKQNISLLSSLAQTSTPAKSQTPAPPPLPAPRPAAKPTQKPSATERPEKNDVAQPFRPVFRPPVAVLEICDDGRDEGESIRIRGDSLTIGRANAEVLIPHDSQISSTHARISRRLVQGSYQWFLTDLNSTNGTFIRVAKVTLADGQFILLGSHRYLFRAAQLPAKLPEPTEGSRNQTRGWQQIAPVDMGRLTPALVRLHPDGTEQPYRLDRDDLVLGQSTDACQLVIADDPAISSVHARIRRNEEGRFVIENMNSRNGVWLAISEQRLQNNAHFQLGEQRFRLRV